MHKEIKAFGIKDAGKTCELYAKIEGIMQTSGPTLFTLFDGTGSIVAKAFAGAGIRAFPELKEGNLVRAEVKLLVYEGALEGEMKNVSLLPPKDATHLMQQIQNALFTKAAPPDTNLLVSSQVLEKLKPQMIAFATAVRQAIMEGRPIILRHNADADGYTAALALEQAIVPLIIAHHADEKAQWHYYRRYPSRSPSYEYGDALKDLATILQDMSRFGMKEPLIILADFGGTRDDVLSLKKVRAYGAKVLVVDHHYPGDVEQHADVFVNPHAVGGDSSNCTGMLATELAHFINPKCQLFLFAAVAAYGDKVSCQESEQYTAKAVAQGYSLELLKHLAECIDFDAHYLRFVESRGLMSDLLLSDQQRQKHLMGMLIEEITERRKASLEAAKHYVEKKEMKNFLFAMVPITCTTLTGEYPAPGKATGGLFDYLKATQPLPVVLFGYGDDFITIRSSYAGFDVNVFAKELEKKFPYALICGGGHQQAGSVHFIEAAQKEILDYSRKWMERAG